MRRDLIRIVGALGLARDGVQVSAAIGRKAAQEATPHSVKQMHAVTLTVPQGV